MDWTLLSLSTDPIVRGRSGRGLSYLSSSFWNATITTVMLSNVLLFILSFKIASTAEDI